MGRKQKYPVKLTAQEREELERVTRAGKPNAQVMRRAQILLWSEAGKQDKEIMELLGCAPMTVSSTRERWGKEKRITDLPGKGREARLDAKQARLGIALACSDAPEGRAEWTMPLLADKLVALQVVERISAETVRRTLKKTSLSRGNMSSGVSRR